MDPAFPNPRFFKHLKPKHWEAELCADLAPVMRLLLADPDNSIASMGLENVKMPDLTVLLRQPPSPEKFVQIEALCAANSKLRAQPGSVVCFDHYSAIEWSLPGDPPPPDIPRSSLWKRLFG